MCRDFVPLSSKYKPRFRIVSKKRPTVPALLKTLAKAKAIPGFPGKFKDFDLLEHSVVYVLQRLISAKQAEASVRSLRLKHIDWNDVRVSQIQDIAECIKSKSVDARKAAAKLVKAYLQDVFQNNHSFDLEFLIDDISGGGKALCVIETLGIDGVHYLQWIATDDLMPVTPGFMRVFDRLGLMDRTQSYKKGLEALTKLSPGKGARAIEFALAFGVVAHNWCDSRKPSCQDCPIVEACGNGVKVRADWLVSQERQAVQKAKEDERERKRIEVEAKKEQRRLVREAKAALADRKKRNQDKKRELGKARKAAEMVAKKAEAEKAKKAAAKKSSSKKVPTKKAAVKKAPKKAAGKKPTTKKAAKKSPAKKAAAKKTPAKKAAAKKTPAKKTVKKAPAKKAAKKTVKKTAKKAPAKKASAKKASTKKASTKKASTKKASTKKSVKKAPAKKAVKKTAKKATKKKAGKKATKKRR